MKPRRLDPRELSDRLDRLRGQELDPTRAIEEATELAADLARLAAAGETRTEARQQRLLARLMEDPDGRAFTAAMTDQALRARGARRVADQLRHLLRVHGIPRYLPPLDRAQLAGFRLVSALAPGLVVPLAVRRVERELDRFVVRADAADVGPALARLAQSGVRANVNLIGEAILGEDEAEARLARYVALAARDDVPAISVKLSSIASQIDLLAERETLETLVARIQRLFRAAHGNPWRDRHGALRPKLVTLDMEEFRDLDLTLEAFCRALEADDLRAFQGGIVLQAYLPDSHAAHVRLLAWAGARVDAGGAPVRVRLVKGANLAMERVDAALHGWPQAPYPTKAAVDASFKRLLRGALEPGHLRVAHVGVGSHNLFDLAYALVLGAAADAGDALTLELLAGIATPLRRVLVDLLGDVLVYSPIVAPRERESAIAYLIRRLDENTATDNFLRHSFDLVPGAPAWTTEAARFVASCEAADAVDTTSRRATASQAGTAASAPEPATSPFRNAPDTDWAIPARRAEVIAVLDRWRGRPPIVLGPVIAGEALTDGAVLTEAPGRAPDSAGGAVVDGFDPSRPGEVPYRWLAADLATADRALDAARAAVATWGATSHATRADLLAAAARGLAAARGDLIAAMVLDAGKAVTEADAEVSEAIDFAEYYRRGLDAFATLPGLHLEPLGVVLVTPPWNFPLAIPAGGALAALMAGSAVILKPASETVLVAHALCEVLWAAGIPRDALQLLPCHNDPVGTALVTDPRVDAVVLTGGTATARRFLELRPDLRLFAETGGKNALIVTALADADLAIKHAVHGAFGHSGQKCSATSLLILEAPVHDSPDFLRRLADAVRSLRVTSAWHPGARVTPLIRPPAGPLATALTELDPGERWLVEPRVDPDNPRLWSPGVKLGVAPGSRTHLTELFGPVLAVMRATSLDEAIALANATPYGLTAGLSSLDDREHARFAARMNAGNLYINRPTTGAIVSRQPFGGRKASAFGPGAKAGGPNYVAQLCRAREDDDARPSDAVTWRAHFLEEHDPARLLGQDNRFRYEPFAGLLIRVGPDAPPADVARVLAAAKVTGVAFLVTAAAPVAGVDAVVEPPSAVAAHLASGHFDRVRVVGPLEPETRAAALAAGIFCDAAPPLRTSRLELLRFAHEQVISHDYHRFGHLGAREHEERGVGLASDR